MPVVCSSSSLLEPAQCGLFHIWSSDTATRPLLAEEGLAKGLLGLPVCPSTRLVLGLPSLYWVLIPHFIILLAVFQFPCLSGLETTEDMRP